MDDINTRYGRGALRVAAEGCDKTWNESGVSEPAVHDQLEGYYCCPVRR